MDEDIILAHKKYAEEIIKMYHGEQYGLSIKTAPEAGTTIRITLPRNPVQKKITVQDTDKEK